jgi:Xaa-Pro aminopeptidase
MTGPADGHAAHDHAARRDRLRAVLPEGVAALLVSGLANVRWLSGLVASHALLVVARDGVDTLATDERYRGPAERLVADQDLGLAIGRDPVVAALDRIGGAIGLEARHVSWSEVRRLEARLGPDRLVATTDLVEELRAVKDPGELSRIRAAVGLTAEALARLAEGGLRPGRTERDVAIELEADFLALGAEGVAFGSIVAAGPNGAVPHHRPGDRPLGTGELVTIDCGATVDGYHADLTRTLAVGTVDGELADLHALVVEAAAAGRAAVRVGATTGDVDAAARAVIEAAGLGARFVHPTGHGIGLEVHEAPAVAAGATATISVGSVLTVEPGVYVPGLGGVRVEDTVAVLEGPFGVALTDLPRGPVLA